MHPLLCGALALLVGCHAPGLTLEVAIDDPSITRVELILGSTCESCPSQMAAPALAPRDAAILESIQTTVWRDEVDGDYAGFELDVDGSADQKVPLLVVVGFAGDRAVAAATLHDVIVPAAETAYWRTFLAPIVPISDGDAPPDGAQRIAVWRHADQAEPSCVMVERWSAGQRDTVAIVPEADPDCDHVARECAPWVPNAIDIPASIETATCVLVAPTADGTACVFGGSPCTDDAPAPASCQRLAQDYCMPDVICTCAPNNVSCLLSVFLEGTRERTVAGVYCTVPVGSDGALCPGATPPTLDATALLQVGTSCKALRVMRGFLSTPSFHDEVAFGSTGKLVLESFQPRCSTDFRWEGTVENPAGTNVSVDMADLELDNGNHLVVPLRVDVVGDCTKDFTCVVGAGDNPDDTLFACARPAP